MTSFTRDFVAVSLEILSFPFRWNNRVPFERSLIIQRWDQVRRMYVHSVPVPLVTRLRIFTQLRIFTNANKGWNLVDRRSNLSVTHLSLSLLISLQQRVCKYVQFALMELYVVKVDHPVNCVKVGFHEILMDISNGRWSTM